MKFHNVVLLVIAGLGAGLWLSGKENMIDVFGMLPNSPNFSLSDLWKNFGGQSQRQERQAGDYDEVPPKVDDWPHANSGGGEYFGCGVEGFPDCRALLHSCIRLDPESCADVFRGLGGRERRQGPESRPNYGARAPDGGFGGRAAGEPGQPVTRREWLEKAAPYEHTQYDSADSSYRPTGKPCYYAGNGRCQDGRSTHDLWHGRQGGAR